MWPSLVGTAKPELQKATMLTNTRTQSPVAFISFSFSRRSVVNDEPLFGYEQSPPSQTKIKALEQYIEKHLRFVKARQ